MLPWSGRSSALELRWPSLGPVHVDRINSAAIQGDARVRYLLPSVALGVVNRESANVDEAPEQQGRGLPAQE